MGGVEGPVEIDGNQNRIPHLGCQAIHGSLTGIDPAGEDKNIDLSKTLECLPAGAAAYLRELRHRLVEPVISRCSFANSSLRICKRSSRRAAGDYPGSLPRKEHCRRAAHAAGSPNYDDHLAADGNRHSLHHTFTTLFGQ